MMDIDSGLMAIDNPATDDVYFTHVEQYFVNQGKAIETWGKAAMALETGNPFEAPADETAEAETLRKGNIALYEKILANARMGKGTELTAAEITALGTWTAAITEDDDTEVLEAQFDDNATRAYTQVTVDGVPTVPVELEVKEPGTDAVKLANMLAGTTTYTGFGAKVAIPGGDGVNFSIAWSQLKADTVASDTEASFMDGNRTVKPYGGGEVKTTLIELGVTYDLGGGATLGASVDKKTAESMMITTKEIDDSNYSHGRVGEVSSEDTTTLEATLAFSF